MNADTARFKIDISGYRSDPVALFVKRPTMLGGTTWERLITFDTIDGAKAHYLYIKDLPEYLA